MSGIEGQTAAEAWIAEAIQDEEDRWQKFLGKFAVKQETETE